MSCSVCNQKLNSGMIRKVKDGKKYKTCPHCTAQNGNEHVYHEYPSEFTTSERRKSSNNIEGWQSWCNSCRTLPKNSPSNNYKNGLTCSAFVTADA